MVRWRVVGGRRGGIGLSNVLSAGTLGALSLLALVLVLACGSRQSGRGRFVEQPIVYPEISRSMARLPFVEATLGGRRVLALVDTGAVQHFVTRSVASERGVEFAPVDFSGEDAHGSRLGEVWLAEPGALHLLELQAEILIVLDNSNMDELGIDVVVSPQRWTREARTAIIDGPRGVLSFASQQPVGANATPLESCRVGDDPRDGFQLVAEVSIDGIRSRLLVDTGAAYTVIAQTAPAAEPLLRASEDERAEQAIRAVVGEDAQPVETTTRASLSVGAAVLDTEHPGVQVGVGGVTKDMTVATTPLLSRSCNTVGVLGWDLLVDCVLAIREDGGSLRCIDEAPAPPIASFSALRDVL